MPNIDNASNKPYNKVVRFEAFGLGTVFWPNSLGRVVLPKELRTTYDITPDTPLEIFTDGDSIIMRKYHAQGSCVFCGDISPDAVLLHGKYVCPACRKALGK